MQGRHLDVEQSIEHNCFVVLPVLFALVQEENVQIHQNDYGVEKSDQVAQPPEVEERLNAILFLEVVVLFVGVKLQNRIILVQKDSNWERCKPH